MGTHENNPLSHDMRNAVSGLSRLKETDRRKLPFTFNGTSFLVLDLLFSVQPRGCYLNHFNFMRNVGNQISKYLFCRDFVYDMLDNTKSKLRWRVSVSILVMSRQFRNSYG